MRRKIEKFLSKKQGVDESSLRYMEDGRFDFMGDVEGVLAAVRGKDSSAVKSAKKSDRKSSRKSVKKNRKEEHKMHPIGMPMYLPYGMAPPYHPGMAPHPMYSHEGMMAPPMHHPYAVKPIGSGPAAGSAMGTDKVPLAPKPVSATQKTPMSRAAQKSSDDEDVSTPFINMSITPGVSSSHRSESTGFSSSRKSIFDSPTKSGLDMGISSPGMLNIHGMTPLSTLRDTFATPYGSQMFSNLSPEDNISLNKALFADDSKTPASKTRTPTEFKICIGNEESMSSFISAMRSHQVLISPLSCKTPKVTSSVETPKDTPDARSSMETSSMMSEDSRSSEKIKTPPRSINRSIHFADEHDNNPLSSVAKVHSFMPSLPVTEAQTPRNVTQDSIDSRDITGPSPFDASLTPIGNYDQGFWGNQLGFSPQDSTTLTPFKSPGINLVSTTKKDRKPLLPVSTNTIPKSETKKSNLKVKSEGEPTPKRQRTEIVEQ